VALGHDADGVADHAPLELNLRQALFLVAGYLGNGNAQPPFLHLVERDDNA
jgi:hypothetical protein